MIVEGCDILLDVNQVFVRQGKYNLVFHYVKLNIIIIFNKNYNMLFSGSLIQLPTDKPKTSRSKLNFKSEKEYLRQCFLFSNHLIIASR